MSDDLIARVQQFAEIIGPNVYLQAAVIALAFILIGKVADIILARAVGRLAKKSTNDLDDRFVALVHRPVFLTFVLIGLALATLRIDLPPAPTFITLGILRTIGIVIWYSTFSKLANLLIEVTSRRSKSKLVQSGMLSLLHNVVKVLLVALAVYFLFVSWNINLTAWVASAGIVGLALSFAARDTLSNLFAGVSIAADAPYKTGDFIVLDSGERGVVTQIGLRSTRLMTRDDVEITIPNGVIGNSKIINEAGGPSESHRIRTRIGVAYGSDIDRVIEVLEGIANDHHEILKNPSPRVRFRNFGESSLDFELLCWIGRPVDRGRLHHELNCALYKSFAANGIEIPFPQRDVHVKTMPAGSV